MTKLDKIFNDLQKSLKLTILEYRYIYAEKFTYVEKEKNASLSDCECRRST